MLLQQALEALDVAVDDGGRERLAQVQIVALLEAQRRHDAFGAAHRVGIRASYHEVQSGDGARELAP